MFPILPILAWTGGIAAGAQVAGGVVRGAGELVRGRPGSALLQVADGCVAPLKTACSCLSELGHDVYTAVLGPWKRELEPEIIRRHRSRRHESTEPMDESFNGVSGVAAAR